MGKIRGSGKRQMLEDERRKGEKGDISRIEV